MMTNWLSDPKLHPLLTQVKRLSIAGSPFRRLPRKQEIHRHTEAIQMKFEKED
ncbi:MAG TPA: hypothetical protein VGO47_09795 [Chlamydiales bacterium]|nr:hypothetical protein [Chlamydiales bacterium]